MGLVICYNLRRGFYDVWLRHICELDRRKLSDLKNLTDENTAKETPKHVDHSRIEKKNNLIK